MYPFYIFFIFANRYISIHFLFWSIFNLANKREIHFLIMHIKHSFYMRLNSVSTGVVTKLPIERNRNLVIP